MRRKNEAADGHGHGSHWRAARPYLVQHAEDARHDLVAVCVEVKGGKVDGGLRRGQTAWTNNGVDKRRGTSPLGMVAPHVEFVHFVERPPAHAFQEAAPR